MKLGIIISTNDPETCWNALRFANFSRSKGDEVNLFLIGRGVEYEALDAAPFNAVEQANKLLGAGGAVYACGTCLKQRNAGESDICPLSTMEDLYRIVAVSDRIITF